MCQQAGDSDFGALKGRDNTAQGNALGWHTHILFEPCEGDIAIGQHLLVAPLQGSNCSACTFPRALPWARLCGPYRPNPGGSLITS